MAAVRIAHFPGASAVHDEALRAQLLGAPVPSGRRLFAAGAVDDGWQVVQVWDRREDLDAFNGAWLLPALRRLGASGFPAPPRVVDFEATDLQLAAPPA